MRERKTPTNPRILRLPEVLDLAGLSKSTLYRRMATREFPQSVNLGGSQTRAKGWVSDQVYLGSKGCKGGARRPASAPLHADGLNEETTQPTRSGQMILLGFRTSTQGNPDRGGSAGARKSIGADANSCELSSGDSAPLMSDATRAVPRSLERP